MGTLFSSLDIAVSGMQAAQVQLDVASHNIANVNTEGYSRQRAELGARMALQFPFGQVGRGVGVTNVTQMRDAFLDQALRRRTPALASAEVESRYYTLIEDMLLEPGDNGLGSQIDGFFDTLSDYSNNVESLPLREATVAEAQGLSATMNQVAQRLDELRTNANDEVRDAVPAINSITARIADLNKLIRESEAGQSQANDLRDERNRLLDQLARYMPVTTADTEAGVTVLLGSETLVDASGARALEAVRTAAIDPSRPDLVEVRFAESGRAVPVSGGSLGAALAVRDGTIPTIMGRMDTLASAVIEQVNRIHTQGNGLTNLSGMITSDLGPGDAAAPLVGNLPFSVSAGSFDVVVYDSSGSATTNTVTVSDTTTLADLASQLNGIAGFSASVSGNRLVLGATGGTTYSFANDTSGVLTGLGVNGLFTGSTAATMGVNARVAADPSLLTSAYSSDPLNTGDNTAALAMAALRNARVFSSGTGTIGDYYEGVVAQLGIDARATNESLGIEQSFVSTFESRRQEVSGVSLDEEVTGLMLYQRAYQAAARVITVTDSMLQTLMSMAL